MAGIYIHIPFCKSKCNYCNFYSVVGLKDKDNYVNSILKEIELQKDYLGTLKINTVYFGGGTPSLLSATEINNIIEKINSVFNLSEYPEITLEINPDDINEDKIKELKDTALNRLSVGIQSFFEDDLKYLKRRHSGIQAKNVLISLLNSGYSNLSADIIYGIPTLTEENLIFNLSTLKILGIPHISAYALTVEPRTALEIAINKGTKTAVSEEQSVEHLKLTLNFLNEKNYINYEISNFCKDGFISIHNSNYWRDEMYLGIGTSAHSYNKLSRQWNVSNVKKYIEIIGNGILPFEKEILSKEQKFNEYLLLGMRTIWGCDLSYIYNVIGAEMHKSFMLKADKFIKQKLIKQENDIICLTEEGKLFADGISSEFFILD